MRKRKKNADEESFKATLLTVHKLMAKPRFAASAQRKKNESKAKPRFKSRP